MSSDEQITGSSLVKVDKFCYLGVMLDAHGGYDGRGHKCSGKKTNQEICLLILKCKNMHRLCANGLSNLPRTN